MQQNKVLSVLKMRKQDLELCGVFWKVDLMRFYRVECDKKHPAVLDW